MYIGSALLLSYETLAVCTQVSDGGEARAQDPARMRRKTELFHPCAWAVLMACGSYNGAFFLHPNDGVSQAPKWPSMEKVILGSIREVDFTT